jgi:hypothetical protein
MPKLFWWNYRNDLALLGKGFRTRRKQNKAGFEPALFVTEKVKLLFVGRNFEGHIQQAKPEQPGCYKNNAD